MTDSSFVCCVLPTAFATRPSHRSSGIIDDIEELRSVM